MDSRQDKIPTWVGRAVTTSELSPGDTADRGQSADSSSRQATNRERSQPTNASRVSLLAEDHVQPDGNDDTSAAPESQSDSSDSVGSTTTDRVSSKGLRFAVLVGVLAAVGLLAVFGSLVLSLPTNGDSAEVATDANTTTPQPSAEASADDSAPVAVSTNDPDAETNSSNDGESATSSRAGADAATSSSDPFVIPNISGVAIRAHRQAALDDGQSAWAVYSDGRIYLQGTLPGDAIAEEITGRLQALLGAGNVIAQYTVESGETTPTDPPLFIKETVVFAPNSAVMPPGSDWILVIAGVLMDRYPTTDLTVIANGSNTALGVTAELQLERAEAVITYLVDRGIDESRLDYEYRSGATFGADTGNKPIEFVVRGLIDEVGQ